MDFTILVKQDKNLLITSPISIFSNIFLYLAYYRTMCYNGIVILFLQIII